MLGCCPLLCYNCKLALQSVINQDQEPCIVRSSFHLFLILSLFCRSSVRFYITVPSILRCPSPITYLSYCFIINLVIEPLIHLRSLFFHFSAGTFINSSFYVLYFGGKFYRQTENSSVWLVECYFCLRPPLAELLLPTLLNYKRKKVLIWNDIRTCTT